MRSRDARDQRERDAVTSAASAECSSAAAATASVANAEASASPACAYTAFDAAAPAVLQQPPESCVKQMPLLPLVATQSYPLGHAIRVEPDDARLACRSACPPCPRTCRSMQNCG